MFIRFPHSMGRKPGRHCIHETQNYLHRNRQQNKERIRHRDRRRRHCLEDVYVTKFPIATIVTMMKAMQAKTTKCIRTRIRRAKVALAADPVQRKDHLSSAGQHCSLAATICVKRSSQLMPGTIYLPKRC